MGDHHQVRPRDFLSLYRRLTVNARASLVYTSCVCDGGGRRATENLQAHSVLLLIDALDNQVKQKATGY